jgi:hypothetical protein
MNIKRVSALTVLVVAKVEALREPEQHSRHTVDAVEV